MYTSLAAVVIHIVLIHKLTVRSNLSCSDLLPTALVLILGIDQLTRPLRHLTPTTLRHLAVPINSLPQDQWLLLQSIIALNTRHRLSRKIPSVVDRRAHDQIHSPNTHTCRKSIIDHRWSTRLRTDLAAAL